LTQSDLGIIGVAIPKEEISMKRSVVMTTRIAALALMLLSIAMTPSDAHAGAKCPNRYFKKVEAKSIGETQKEAETAYPDALAVAANKSKNDCDNCECEEEGETCTYQHTELKKPKCHKKAEKDFRCVGWVRPGCFCMAKDEAIITEAPAPQPAGGSGKKE